MKDSSNLGARRRLRHVAIIRHSRGVSLHMTCCGSDVNGRCSDVVATVSTFLHMVYYGNTYSYVMPSVKPEVHNVGPVAYLGFCEGGPEPKTRGSRRRRRQWGGVWGGGVPSPLKKGSGDPRIKKKIFGSMCSKNFCVQAKGGGHRPVAP